MSKQLAYDRVSHNEIVRLVESITELRGQRDELLAALREYHALMGNVHMLRESTESRQRWMAARYAAQGKAQAALQKVAGAQ